MDKTRRVQFSTPRCILRPATIADLPHVEQGIGDPLFPLLLPLSEMHRDGQLQDWLERMCERGARGDICLWSVDLRSGEPCIGQVGLVRRGESGEWMLSFWLAPRYWGKSLAREAVGRLLQYAFAEHGIEHVSAAAATWNVASKSLLLSFGFQVAGESDAGYEVDGKAQAVIEFSLSAPGRNFRFS